MWVVLLWVVLRYSERWPSVCSSSYSSHQCFYVVLGYVPTHSPLTLVKLKFVWFWAVSIQSAMYPADLFSTCGPVFDILCRPPCEQKIKKLLHEPKKKSTPVFHLCIKKENYSFRGPFQIFFLLHVVLQQFQKTANWKSMFQTQVRLYHLSFRFKLANSFLDRPRVEAR